MSDDEPTLLHPFRKRDPLTGKWYRARYKASAEEIARHDGEWIADGPPEIYPALGSTSGFRQWRAPAAERLLLHPQRQRPPAVDELERLLAVVFLRRYVTHCIRRRRFAEAQGAASLHRELAHPAGAPPQS